MTTRSLWMRASRLPHTGQSRARTSSEASAASRGAPRQEATEGKVDASEVLGQEDP